MCSCRAITYSQHWAAKDPLIVLWWQKYLYFVLVLQMAVREINLICLPKKETVWIDFEPRIKRAERPIRAQPTVSSAGLETLYLALCLTLSHHTPSPFAIPSWVVNSANFYKKCVRTDSVLTLSVSRFINIESLFDHLQSHAGWCAVSDTAVFCYFYPCSGCFQ